MSARTWLFWALTAMIAVLSTTNPLYVIILLLITGIVGVSCVSVGSRSVYLLPLRFMTFAVPLATVFNALTVHVGETVLLRIPDAIPMVGGPVTLEAVVFGATAGLTMTAIIAVFAVFNVATRVQDLLQMAPAALRESGLILSIALVFVPQTGRSLARIREAQAIRGHRLRGLAGWAPILVPLLISGLEQSMSLAEAMTARGYGSTRDRRQPLPVQTLLAIGLLLVLSGWLARQFAPHRQVESTVVLLSGIIAICAALWLAGRSVRRTTYRPSRWSAGDVLATIGCVVALTTVVVSLPFVYRDTLIYSPYSRISLPSFDPVVALGLFGLLAPALMGWLASLRSLFSPTREAQP